MSKDKSRRHGISSWCKECRVVSSRTWEKKNPEKKKETYRLSRDKPISSMKVREWTLKTRYNLTLEDYDNLLKTQDYKCAICTRDSRSMTYYLHVDHCHTTNKVRGLLCAPCNVYLGYSKDNDQVFKNGILYLDCHKIKSKEERGNQENPKDKKGNSGV